MKKYGVIAIIIIILVEINFFLKAVKKGKPFSNLEEAIKDIKIIKEIKDYSKNKL